jgi:hypothetical protein
MEQRRKIIISTGTEGEETLSTPHFDTEATLAAKPVVPLTEPVALPPTQPQNAYAVPHEASYSPRSTKGTEASTPWKRSTLILIILAAVSVGIASGLAIGLYQSRNKTSAPVVAQPAAVNETQQATTQIPAETTQLPQVKQPEQPPEMEEASADKETVARVPVEETDDDSIEKARREDRRTEERDDKRSDDKPAARDNPKRDEARVPARVERDRPVDYPVVDEREDKIERRERRREERREERRAERRRQREENSDGPLNFPRSAERARQEINRIRDIFEGRQP